MNHNLYLREFLFQDDFLLHDNNASESTPPQFLLAASGGIAPPFKDSKSFVLLLNDNATLASARGFAPRFMASEAIVLLLNETETGVQGEIRTLMELGLGQPCLPLHHSHMMGIGSGLRSPGLPQWNGYGHLPICPHRNHTHTIRRTCN